MPELFRTAVAAITLAAVLTGCTGSDQGSGPSASSASSRSSAPRAAAAIGSAATPYPVAPSASASPVPAIETHRNSSWTLSLTAVRTAGPGALVVEGVLTPKIHSVFTEFTEHGYEFRKTPASAGSTSLATREFSAVQLAKRGDATAYLPMRDNDGACACTEVTSSGVDPGQGQGVFVYMTAPPGATTVDVLVRGFTTFTDVPVTP